MKPTLIQFIEFIFSDFMIWLGFVLIMSGVGEFLYKCFDRLMYYIAVWKNGWPEDRDGKAE